MSAEPQMKATEEVASKAFLEKFSKDTEKSIKNVYSLVEVNLGAVGGLDCAADCARVDRGDLRRALDGKGRYLAIDHVMRIGARLRQFNASASTLLSAAAVRPMGMLVFPLVELTAEERARRMEKMLLSMPLGEQLLAAALETP